MILLDLNFGLHLALHSHAERCEMESEALIIDPALLPTLEGLLQEMYASLRPEPVNYEHRHLMVDVFNKIAEQIFGKRSFVCHQGVKDLYSHNVLLRSLLTMMPGLYLNLKFCRHIYDLKLPHS